MFESIDWRQLASNLAHLMLAFCLVVPMGWNRETTARSAGLRTFPIVAVAACGYVLVGTKVFDSDAALARVAYGVVTGIGFIGGGAILKAKGNVTGTATAASIWNTGAVGMAVALRCYVVAVALAAINFIVLVGTRPLKERLRGGGEEESQGFVD